MQNKLDLPYLIRILTIGEKAEAGSIKEGLRSSFRVHPSLIGFRNPFCLVFSLVMTRFILLLNPIRPYLRFIFDWYQVYDRLRCGRRTSNPSMQLLRKALCVSRKINAENSRNARKCEFKLENFQFRSFRRGRICISSRFSISYLAKQYHS